MVINITVIVSIAYIVHPLTAIMIVHLISSESVLLSLLGPCHVNAL